MQLMQDVTSKRNLLFSKYNLCTYAFKEDKYEPGPRPLRQGFNNIKIKYDDKSDEKNHKKEADEDGLEKFLIKAKTAEEGNLEDDADEMIVLDSEIPQI